MSFASNLNFFSTVVSFGCVSFAASNFGIKFGRAITFINPSGYDYISDSKNAEKLYETISEEAKKETNAPEWATNKVKLRRWCEKHQKKARKWKETSKYCLLKNNVRHQLISEGYELHTEEKSTTPEGSTSHSTASTTASKYQGCTNEVFDSYADNTHTSVGYLFAVAKCATHTDEKKPQAPRSGVPASPANAAAAA